MEVIGKKGTVTLTVMELRAESSQIWLWDISFRGTSGPRSPENFPNLNGVDGPMEFQIKNYVFQKPEAGLKEDTLTGWIKVLGSKALSNF